MVLLAALVELIDPEHHPISEAHCAVDQLDLVRQLVRGGQEPQPEAALVDIRCAAVLIGHGQSGQPPRLQGGEAHDAAVQPAGGQLQQLPALQPLRLPGPQRITVLVVEQEPSAAGVNLRYPAGRLPAPLAPALGGGVQGPHLALSAGLDGESRHGSVRQKGQGGPGGAHDASIGQGGLLGEEDLSPAVQDGNAAVVGQIDPSLPVHRKGGGHIGLLLLQLLDSGGKVHHSQLPAGGAVQLPDLVEKVLACKVFSLCLLLLIKVLRQIIVGHAPRLPQPQRPIRAQHRAQEGVSGALRHGRGLVLLQGLRRPLRQGGAAQLEVPRPLRPRLGQVVDALPVGAGAVKGAGLHRQGHVLRQVGRGRLPVDLVDGFLFPAGRQTEAGQQSEKCQLSPCFHPNTFLSADAC